MTRLESMAGNSHLVKAPVCLSDILQGALLITCSDQHGSQVYCIPNYTWEVGAIDRPQQ